MRRLTLCLLLDAFRPDYLRHAPYLRALAGGQGGELREPFGFLPRAAYFGGLAPDEIGFSNMYVYDPERSPFGIARALDTRRVPAEVYEQCGVRALIDRSARTKVAPFARDYASSAKIPLGGLPSFDLVEQFAPWDRRVGYRSIFHTLDDRGERWFECSWPGTNRLADRSDRGIVAAALDRADSRARFGFVHLQELDACGHRYGPGAPETRDCIRATDAAVEELVEALRRKWDALDVLAFGDHGMVTVTRAVDVRPACAATRLKAGLDYTCFVDSTMMRVWVHTAAARRLLPAVLERVPAARLLSEADRRRFRIARCDWRNGELFLLAEPGVVFQPNFFQGDDAIPKGMHGYNPDCADNRGVFVCASPLMAPASGIVDATELHGLLSRLLFEPEHAPVRTPRQSRGVSRARFTQATQPAAQSVVNRQLHAIARTIVARSEDPPPRAIVVTGSFGRGEGGVVEDGDGFHAVNDYDVLVVDPIDRSPLLRTLRDELPGQFGLDFLDLAWADGRWDACAPSIANFDLKYGSTVIFGDSGVLDRLPSFTAAEIPRAEGVQLLLNRMGGLLTGMDEWPGQAAHDARRRYLANQYVKAASALGDSHLLEWQEYDCSYLVRGRRFRALAPGAGVDAGLIDVVSEAYALKVVPDYAAIPELERAVRALIPALLARLAATIASCGDGSRPSLEGALRAYITVPLAPEIQADNAKLAERAAIRSVLSRSPDPLTRAQPSTSIRHLVYSTLPLLLAEAGRPVPSFRPRTWPASPLLDLPETVDGWAGWQKLRERLTEAWFAVIH